MALLQYRRSQHCYKKALIRGKIPGKSSRVNLTSQTCWRLAEAPDWTGHRCQPGLQCYCRCHPFPQKAFEKGICYLILTFFGFRVPFWKLWRQLRKERWWSRRIECRRILWRSRYSCVGRPCSVSCHSRMKGGPLGNVSRKRSGCRRRATSRGWQRQFAEKSRAEKVVILLDFRFQLKVMTNELSSSGYWWCDAWSINLYMSQRRISSTLQLLACKTNFGWAMMVHAML